MSRPLGRVTETEFAQMATAKRPGSVKVDGETVVSLNDAERILVLEALAGFFARSASPTEVTACMRLAQRIEGFDVGGDE